jgi:hypothetical protein
MVTQSDKVDSVINCCLWAFCKTGIATKIKPAKRDLTTIKAEEATRQFADLPNQALHRGDNDQH